ncbi:hypothetical protein [Microbispora bryophytorum]|uniref:hypothetical protein n=1 Tax=Microbispora bryophytorum TaxID=1460882 RepID=UPI00340EF010
MIKAEVDRIRNAMGNLCEPLHDVLTTGEQRWRKDFTDFHASDYGWYHTHTLRALAHLGLGKKNLGVWRLTGNPNRNGELWLTDGGYHLRMLHTLSKTLVPPPGANHARQAYYSNVPLRHGQPPLFGVPGVYVPPQGHDRLLGLWRIDEETGMPSIRIVRPTGTWKFGEDSETDIDFLLPRTAEELASLKFVPVDEHLPFFAETDEEEGGEDGAAGIPG